MGRYVQYHPVTVTSKIVKNADCSTSTSKLHSKIASAGVPRNPIIKPECCLSQNRQEYYNTIVLISNIIVSKEEVHLLTHIFIVSAMHNIFFFAGLFGSVNLQLGLTAVKVRKLRSNNYNLCSSSCIFCSPTCHFISLRLNYSPQHLFSNMFNMCSPFT